jgi:hypothetical protein
MEGKFAREIHHQPRPLNIGHAPIRSHPGTENSARRTDTTSIAQRGNTLTGYLNGTSIQPTYVTHITTPSLPISLSSITPRRTHTKHLQAPHQPSPCPPPSSQSHPKANHPSNEQQPSSPSSKPPPKATTLASRSHNSNIPSNAPTSPLRTVWCSFLSHSLPTPSHLSFVDVFPSR